MSDIVTVPGKELKKLQLKARAFDGLPFCPDHRDKVANKPCRECEIDHLQTENKQLEEENRWIPVSERLPELITTIPHPHSKDVLLAHKRNGLQTGYYCEEQGWVIYSSYLTPDRYQKRITHWKPIILPKQALQEKPK